MKKLLATLVAFILVAVPPVYAGDAAAFLSNKVPTAETPPAAKNVKKTKKRKKARKNKETVAGQSTANEAAAGSRH